MLDEAEVETVAMTMMKVDAAGDLDLCPAVDASDWPCEDRHHGGGVLAGNVWRKGRARG